ncbi:MAG: aminoacetone oxidase family FAD-binding enzyme [Candidatus Limivivens sp.]|nr:aminoacetone oxidase family FAD-binding enzyme [Candidatus Limivivens sp.]
MQVVVIGAGASGLMAAIFAAASGARVTVLESMEKPGKKLLTTGNGRCNLTNRFAGTPGIYRGGDPRAVRAVLAQYPPEKTLDDFASFGLFTQEKQDGCVYPVSGQASSVLEILLAEAARRKVKIKCREKAAAIEREGTHWKVVTETWSYEADRVILACGSKAAPLTGSDGSGYALAEALGHGIRRPLPALVPLKIRDQDIRSLEGVRCHAKVTLQTEPEKAVYEAEGELQWTGYGISGIVVFQLSRYAVCALAEGKKATVRLDLLDGLDRGKIRERMLRSLERCPGKTNEELFAGLFSKKLVPFLIRRSGAKNGQPASGESISRILEASGAICLEVCGSKSFEAAQCCSGGVPLSEVNTETMESKIAPGIYLTGELLDADGPCGGDNLQWAWSTGAIAGIYAGVKKE